MALQSHKKSKSFFSRRDFMKISGASLVSSAFIKPSFKKKDLSINIFSKHLQAFNYNEMSSFASEVGFEGIDLTVRPRGHVLPERVSKDLPKAVESIRKAGLSIDMITTSVKNANDPEHKRVLEVASELGIRYYRMAYFAYPDLSKGTTLIEVLKNFTDETKALSKLNEKLDIVGCYQNHSGKKLVGSNVWEIWKLISESDPNFSGIQYDIRHATVEGGESWENGVHLINNNIKTIALKDFKWGKIDNHWKIINTPIGEGMVDFEKYFSLLKKYKIFVPASLHFEYSLGGAEHGSKKLGITKNSLFENMKKDLNTIRKYWDSAA